MKKIILVPFLLLAAGLTGCKNKAKFQEYKFDEQLSSSEAENLASKVMDQMKNCTGFEMNSSSSQTVTHQESSTSQTIKCTFYENYHVHTETSTSSSSSVDGITVKTSNKIVSDRFDYASENAIVTYTKNNKDGLSFSIDNYSSSTERDNMNANAYSSQYGSFLISALSLTAYKDGSGYAFASSSIDESVVAVEWGSSTKEYKTLSRTQRICKIDRNYKITSYYDYADAYTNRDPNTGEWYKKSKLIGYNATTYTVKYGTKASGNSVRQSIQNEFAKGYIESISANLSDTTLSYVSINMSCPLKYDNPRSAHLLAVGTYNSSPTTCLLKPTITVNVRQSVSGSLISRTLEKVNIVPGENVTLEIMDGQQYVSTSLSYNSKLYLEMDISYLDDGNLAYSDVVISKR